MEINNIIGKLKLIFNLLNKYIYLEVAVFVFSLFIRVPTLGYDLINNDAYLWKDRGYVFGANLVELDFAGTNVTYHPGVVLLYLLSIANKIYTLLSNLGVTAAFTGSSEFFVNHFLQKFVVVVFNALLITTIFYFLRKLVNTRNALLFTLILNLEPMFLLLSREIHTDSILSSTIFLSLITFFLVFRGDNLINRYYLGFPFLVSAFSLSLALLTKSSALALFLFYGVVIAVKYSKYKRIEVLKAFGGFLVVTLLFFVILWPAMWVSPINTLNDYFFKGIKSVGVEEGHGHIWFGKETLDPGPLFYPLAIVGKFSMEIIIAFFISLYFLFNDKSNKNRAFYLYLMLFMAVYFAIITIASKKLDRYALPLILPMLLIALYSLKEYLNRRVFLVFMLVFLVYRGYLLYSLHPNYHSYYSPLVGGTETGLYLLEPKWLIGYDEVAKYFNSRKNAKNIKVAIADYDYLKPFGIFQTLNIKHEVEANTANYIVVPTYRTERNKEYMGQFNVNRAVEEITVAGYVYYYVFEIIKPLEATSIRGN